jgi:hypothetical protein
MDFIGIPQIPQNSSVPDSGFPHERQILIMAGGGCRSAGDVLIFGAGSGEWGFAVLSELAPHIPQNFPVSKSSGPHEVHTRGGADVGISGSGCTVRSCSLMGDPHIPQNFS